MGIASGHPILSGKHPHPGSRLTRLQITDLHPVTSQVGKPTWIIIMWRLQSACNRPRLPPLLMICQILLVPIHDPITTIRHRTAAY